MSDFVAYKNGNYLVLLNTVNGTKIRQTLDKYLDAEFPENIDMKITNYCEIGCEFCHEGSNINGKHADLSLKNNPFLSTLKPYTELAIGGGSVMSHPDLVSFLKNMKKLNVICNITVHQSELLYKKDSIQKLIDDKLVHGIGVSVTAQDLSEETIEFARKNRNVVFHMILGLTKLSDLEKMYGKGFKILLLGYKDFRRGLAYKLTTNKLIDDNISELSDHIKECFDKFEVISFDNLAISQLSLKDKLSEDEFRTFYMGDDGKFTMYIDLVERKYAVNSTMPVEARMNLKDNIIDMFKDVKNI